MIHVAYANFSGNDSNDSASIIQSTDYGQSWSSKNKLSESIALNQGVALAANGDSVAFAVWRQFDKNNNQADSFAYASSKNGGRNWSKPATVPLSADQICTFDQPSQLPEATYALRTKALPSLVSDGRRFYLLWARRTFDEFGNPSCTRGRSRISYLTTDGTSWTRPYGWSMDSRTTCFLTSSCRQRSRPAAWWRCRGMTRATMSSGRMVRRCTAHSSWTCASGWKCGQPSAHGRSTAVRSQRRRPRAPARRRLGEGLAVRGRRWRRRLPCCPRRGRPATSSSITSTDACSGRPPSRSSASTTPWPRQFRLDQGGKWVSNQGALGSDPGPRIRHSTPSGPTTATCAATSTLRRRPASPVVPGSPSVRRRRTTRRPMPMSQSSWREPGGLRPGNARATGSIPRLFACVLPASGTGGIRASATRDLRELRGLPGGPAVVLQEAEESLKALSRNPRCLLVGDQAGCRIRHCVGDQADKYPARIRRVGPERQFGNRSADVSASTLRRIRTTVKSTVPFTQSGAAVPSLTVQVPESARRARYSSNPPRRHSSRVRRERPVSCKRRAERQSGGWHNQQPDCGGKSCDGSSVMAYEGHNPDLIGHHIGPVPFVSQPQPPRPRACGTRSTRARHCATRRWSSRACATRACATAARRLIRPAAELHGFRLRRGQHRRNTTSAYTLKPLITGPLTDPDGNPLSPELIVSSAGRRPRQLRNA